MRHHYDIHGLTVRIDGITEAAVPDLNTKLHHFVVQREIESPDIDISIGPFEPDRRDCLCLDRRYWARPGHLVLEESDKGLSWTAQLSGLDPSDRRGLSIMFEHRPTNRRKWRWRFFPDLVMHLYVLWPVLECQLARRGLYLVHAGGVCRDGKALLVAGRGGVNKTAVVAELVRRGYEPLGDDFVLLHPTDEGTEVLSFPTSPRWFQYQLGRQHEAMGLVEQRRGDLRRAGRA